MPEVSVSTLANNIRELYTNRSATRPTTGATPLSDSDPLYLVIESYNKAGKGDVYYLKCSLSNGVDKVSLEGFYSLSNIEVKYCRSENIAPETLATSKNVQPTVSVVWNFDDYITPPPAPTWMREIMDHNNALIAKVPCPIDNSSIQTYREVLAHLKPDATSDGTEYAYVMKEYCTAVKWIGQNADAIVGDKTHPCHTPSYAAIVVGDDNIPVRLGRSDVSGKKWHGGYEPFYKKPAKDGKASESVITNKAVIAFRWMGTPPTRTLIPPKDAARKFGTLCWSKQTIGDAIWYRPVRSDVFSRFQAGNTIISKLTSDQMGKVFTSGTIISKGSCTFEVSLHGQGVSCKGSLWSFNFNHHTYDSGQDYGFGGVDTIDDISDDIANMNVASGSTSPPVFHDADTTEDTT